MSPVTLNLAGPVTVTGPDAEMLTPFSMKARGLLAILGTSRGLRAARSRLQDKLWSDRSLEQGSSSLRQALSEIRRKLGPYRDVLLTGPGWIGLDPSRVDVVLTPPSSVAPGTVEFADDLDIRDPEFDDWLRLQRQHYSDLWSNQLMPALVAASSDPVVLVLAPDRLGQADLDGFAALVLRDAAARAADLLPIATYSDIGALSGFPNAFVASAAAYGPVEAFLLQVAVVHHATNRQVWSRTFVVERDNAARHLRDASAELSLALMHAASGSGGADAAGSAVPLADIFSFAKDRLDAAEARLSNGPETAPSLAMRAYIRNTQLIERFATDPVGMRAEATDLANRAVALAPQSATALSVAGIIAARNGHHELSSELSHKAVRADPLNPLARHSRSIALGFLGRDDEAFDEALGAQQAVLASVSPAILATGVAATAIRARRFDQAIRFASIAHGYAPAFRPPLRMLGALNYHLGREDEAETALTRLRELEPDFSLNLMADRSYPVASLRAAGLLGVTESRLI